MKHWIGGLLGQLMLVGLALGDTAGQTAEPVHAGSCVELTPPLASPPEAWEGALRHTERCQKDIQYLTSAARWLNQQRRYEEAQLYAERALLLAPADVSAWIEFGLSQTGLGDAQVGVEALARAKDLAVGELSDGSGFAPVSEERVARLREWVLEISSLLAAGGVPERRPATTRVLNARVGYATNFYGGPTARAIELTLPSGSVETLIIPSLLPKEGFFSAVGISKNGTVSAGGRVWSFDLRAGAKALLSDPSQSTASVQAWGEYALEPLKGSILGGGVTALFSRNTLNAFEIRGAYGRQMPSFVDCRLRISAEGMLRHYPSSSAADGLYLGLVQSAACPGELEWLVRLGLDQPRKVGGRPSGIHQHLEFQLNKKVIYKGSKALYFMLNSWIQIDQKGFSPLLENNVPRQIAGASFRAEHRWGRQRGLDPYFAWEGRVQGSNIDIFQTRGAVIEFGLERKW